MTFLLAIVLLGILIFVHELGHFLFAKLMGVRVLKFSLGFGPKVIGRKVGDTEYLISAFPLGGYVKMLGEEQGVTLKEEEKAFAYNLQPVRKRFWILFSGPLFNMLFAVVIFIFIFANGIPILYPDVGEVIEDSPASHAGIQKGDRVIGINAENITEWDEMTGIIHGSPEKGLDLKIKRGQDIISLKIVPERKVVKNIFGEENEIGLIGIKPLGNTFIKRFGVPDAVKNGFIKTYEVTALTIISVIKLLQRVIPAETIGGPILIVQMAGEQASRGVLNFFTFMAIISVNLGILNLLPIPVLDGGHIMFLGIEAIRRKPLDERTMLIAQRIGLAVIITLMAFALYNDIMRLFEGKGLP
ncbi:MAG: RIP metalloprotease RseP [Nitrospirae bacterium]|nr:RIP metalloprotease RseP [Nitrospirota bacterium]